MLTLARRALTGLLVPAALVVTSLLAVVLIAPSAEAADGPTCDPPAVISFPASGGYVCTIPGGGGGAGGGGGGGSNEPQCDLSYNEGAYLGLSPDSSGNYCKGTTTCFNVAHFTPHPMPDGDKPNKDSKARIEFCFTTPFDTTVERIYWTDDEEPPSLLEQALTAIGQIAITPPTVNVSPSGRTLVNLDTWFWVTGTQREATGSSAFGLVAIATLRSLTIDPGDGTGSFTCPWTATKEDAERDCYHEYRRASLRGSASVDGRPAYAVTARTVYDLRFEVNGSPSRIPGAPTTLEGPPGQTAVRVDEVQTTVKRVG
ncbi:MAG: hypothetical protein JWQ91_1484 [Aeromicrobium sp.]|uniref:hypothetical protein n=1 Tax=Aeromicrobium sp. TaxID=1871063 RepID=UPI0026076DFB|nr:hypothetical protein [Aeromicrobium sp.]MCW2824567.1 hypothetical protein [Aeromicrobium sp.]